MSRYLPCPSASSRALAAVGLFLAANLLSAWLTAAASAATPPAALAQTALEPGEEEPEAEETSEEGGSEAAEEGLEVEAGDEGEWLEIEGEGDEEEPAPDSILPPECLLRTAHPRAILDSAHDKVRLALAFKAWNPTELEARFSLMGPRGALRLDGRTRRPSRTGTLHLSRDLDGPALRKAEAARLVVVRLDVPATPSYCHLALRLPPVRR